MFHIVSEEWKLEVWKCGSCQLFSDHFRYYDLNTDFCCLVFSFHADLFYSLCIIPITFRNLLLVYSIPYLGGFLHGF